MISLFLFALVLAGCNKNAAEAQSADGEEVSSIDKPMSAPDFEQRAPLVVSIEKFPATVGHQEFIDWVSTKLRYEEGLLRGIITAKYKGKTLRVALIYYGDMSWQYIYDPIILNSDMKAIFGFYLTGGIIENNDQAVEDNYPTFEVPEDQSKKFVKVVHRHMKLSNLLEDLEIIWKSEEGSPISKPPVGY